MVELTGRVLHPGDPGWDEARTGFNSRINYDTAVPAAVVFCQNTDDVANAVRWARERRVAFRVRCGRHNYEGYSSLAKDGLIVDVSELANLRMDTARGVAVIGAGIHMARLVELLWEHGVTIPTATGASVGLAGLVLGGGFGVTSRRFGLTCDNLVNVELVTADGEIVNANQHERPDLFWASQGGGGGNFGIATAFTFIVHPVSVAAIFSLSWPWERFEEIVDLWQNWAPEADDSLSTFLRLGTDRTITLFGQVTSAPQDLPRVSRLLAPVMLDYSPGTVSVQVLPFIAAARFFCDVDPQRPQWFVQAHSDRQIYKSTSALAYESFDDAAIRTLREHLESAPPLSASPKELSMVQLLGGGGAASRVAPDATAVVHRQARFIVQYNSFWLAPQDAEKTIDWVVAMRRAMLAYTRGAYVNYVDGTIDDWQRAYYDSNLKRLVEVKQRYDPENVFNFPQSIPTSL